MLRRTMRRAQQVHDEGYSPIEEVLQDQEIVYQSIRNSITSNTGNTSKDRPGINNQLSDEGKEALAGKCSPFENLESQLAEDEALARALQASLSEISSNEEAKSSSHSSSTAFRERNSIHSTDEVVRSQDDIDPDNMTYEELQSLGETIGTESRGLSDELIGYLPLSKYKIGLFSKKEKHDECVICCVEYKNRDKLITLPCQHHYHSVCVSKWLKMNKACPVCQVEVFG